MNLKLMHISVHFEYADIIEEVLDRHEIIDYVAYPMLEGRDEEGKHDGTQVHPGNFTAIHAQVPTDKIDPIFQELAKFREEKLAHKHLEAVILPIERRL